MAEFICCCRILSFKRPQVTVQHIHQSTDSLATQCQDWFNSYLASEGVYICVIKSGTRALLAC